MDAAFYIANNYAAIVPLQHGHQQLRLLDFARRHSVLFEKVWQRPVRIKNVAVLVGAVQTAVSKRFQQSHALGGSERSGTEHRHLAFQHLVQYPSPDRVSRDGDQIVRMVKPIAPAIGVDGMIGVLQGDITERLQTRSRYHPENLRLQPVFRFDLRLFALKIGFVLGSFFAPKNAKSCVFNRSLGSFPLFSIFFALSCRFAPPAVRFRISFLRSLPALSISQLA